MGNIFDLSLFLLHLFQAPVPVQFGSFTAVFPLYLESWLKRMDASNYYRCSGAVPVLYLHFAFVHSVPPPPATPLPLLYKAALLSMNCRHFVCRVCILM